jgi:hypothetical protein
MNRKYFRLVSVAAVVVAMNVATFPAAEARPLSGSHTTANHTSDLWSATVTWLTGLLPGHAGLRPAARATTSIGGTNTGTAQPNTGSCIDPMGGSTHCSI